MRLLVIGILVLCSSVGFGQLPPNMRDSLQHWFIGDVYMADIYKIGPNRKATEYKRIMRDSIKSKIEWFKEFSKGVAPGDDLPYHENLGVTKEQYDDFLKLQHEDEFYLRGRAKFFVKPDSSNTSCKFKSEGVIVGVNYLRIDYETGLIHIESPNSPKATLPITAILQPNEEQKFMGSKYSGYSWEYKSRNFDDGDGVYYQVDLMHLFETDRIFMQITAQTASNGKVQPANIVPFSYPRNEPIESKSSTPGPGPKVVRPN